MIQIRSSVFETNSSSSHSLVIKKQSEYYSEQELLTGMWFHDNNTIEIWDEDDLHFGRTPFRVLETFYGKMRYAIASMCAYAAEPQTVFEEISELVFDIIPGCTDIILPTVYYWHDREEKTYYGHVDENILTPFLEKNNISLREFLTNKRYVVIVDGDEYCIWDDLKNSGLVNQNEIESEFPNYEADSF